MLTTQQAAAQLGVHPAHLERLARCGAIPAAQRFGRQWAFNALAIEQARQRRPRGGSKPTCQCGQCLKCYNRLAQQRSRARRKERTDGK